MALLGNAMCFCRRLFTSMNQFKRSITFLTARYNFTPKYSRDTSFSSSTCYLRFLTSERVTGESQDQTVDTYRHLIKDDSMEKKVKLILMEFQLAKMSETNLPDCLTEQDIIELLEMKSPFLRIKYITRYLRKRHLHTLAKQKPKTEIKLKSQVKETDLLKNENGNHIIYGLGHNALHYRIRDKCVKTFYAHCLSQAAMFEQPLVFDCSFDEYMKKQEYISTATQLCNVYGENYTHRKPFDLVFCNVQKTSEKRNILPYLERLIPNLHEPLSMVTVSEKSYLDLFPDKTKLIYLSPDAPDAMNHFDNDAVYIIGAFSDLGPKVRRTLAKANQDNIQTLKLPLDKYLLFQSGACKSLPLYQVALILLELRLSGDWKKALNLIPKRAVLSQADIIAKKSEQMQSTKKSFKRPQVNISSLLQGS